MHKILEEMTSTWLSLMSTILLKSFISGLIISQGKESPVSGSTTLPVLISRKGVELKTVDDSWRQWMTSSNLQVLWLPPQGNQCHNLQSPSQPSPWVSACLCIKPTHIWLSTKLKAYVQLQNDCSHQSVMDARPRHPTEDTSSSWSSSTWAA